MAHVAAREDPWAETLAAACHTHKEAVDHIRASVAALAAHPYAVVQASVHRGVAAAAPSALAAHHSRDEVRAVRAAVARSPLVASALQVAACARTVVVHSLVEVDHSLGEVAAAHVARDVPLVVANEVVPSALAAWKHQGDCHSHNAMVAALLP